MAKKLSKQFVVGYKMGLLKGRLESQDIYERIWDKFVSKVSSDVNETLGELQDRAMENGDENSVDLRPEDLEFIENFEKVEISILKKLSAVREAWKKEQTK